MNSRERFLAALHGHPTDRPPVAHVAAMTTVELQQSSGCPMPEAHLDAEKLVGLSWANHEVLGFDAVTFIINYFNEPAALGVEMDWGHPEQLPVFRSHPWQSAGDARVPDDLLSRPPVSTYLEAIGLARQRYGEQIAVLGKVMGPLSMVQVMHGIDRTMIDLVDRPELIEGFLDVATEVLVACGNAQFERGIEALSIGEGGAGANMLSPRMYEQLLLPVHQKMIAALKGPTVMHVCGDVRNRVDRLAETGLTCFNFDWAIPPTEMVAAAAGRFSLMGNINTADLLNATPEEVRRQTRENLEAGVEIIGPGCAVSPKCPNANLRAMVDEAERGLEPPS
jgi:[methyl-Co(III) methanol-specific corrinoid protein]:coenzyme M methyltransferase